MSETYKSAGDKKILVDQSICIGCGLCASLCPDTFEISEDDYKSHTKEGGSCADEACCQGAIDSCPVAAISWE